MTRIYLHIGLQKTGTSYLQNLCWSSVEELEAAGVTLVPPSRMQTFWLALDVRGRVDPATDAARVAQSVDRLPAQLAAVRTPAALITQETLGSAGPAQIRRLVEACAGHEVHVVLTVRDIGRQIPSLWQECLKAGRAETLDEYVAGLRGARRRTGVDWRRLDLPGVLRRWAEVVPAERIHVVTVPPPGGERTALLDRFCAVLGIDPSVLPAERAGRGNPGLGTAEAEVLRRVNAQLPEDLRSRVPYGQVGKRWFAMGILSRSTSERIVLPPEHAPWCTELGEESVRAVAELGCDLVGDAADLVPVPDVFGETRAVDDPALDAAALRVATRALAEVLEERLVEHREERQRAAARARRLGGPLTRAALWVRRRGRSV